MGSVLSLPFLRRRTARRRRAPVSTPISHPRPLLRRDPTLELAEQLELLSNAGIGSSKKSTIGRRTSSSGRTSRASRRTSRHARGMEFGVLSQSLATDDAGSGKVVPDFLASMSSASTSISSKPSASTLRDHCTPVKTAAALPAVRGDAAETDAGEAGSQRQSQAEAVGMTELVHARTSSSASGSGVGSKRRAADTDRRRTRPRTRSSSEYNHHRSSLIIGTKMTPAARRASTLRKQHRRLESGWDLIRHEEADGWAPAAGRSMRSLSSLEAGSLRGLRRVQWTRGT